MTKYYVKASDRRAWRELEATGPAEAAMSYVGLRYNGGMHEIQATPGREVTYRCTVTGRRQIKVVVQQDKPEESGPEAA